MYAKWCIPIHLVLLKCWISFRNESVKNGEKQNKQIKRVEQQRKHDGL